MWLILILHAGNAISCYVVASIVNVGADWHIGDAFDVMFNNLNALSAALFAAECIPLIQRK